ETYSEKIATQFREFIHALEDVLDKKELKDPNTGKQLGSDKDDKVVADQAKEFKLENLDIRTQENQKKAHKIYNRHWERIQFFIDGQEGKLNALKRGDELPAGCSRWSRCTSPPSG